ncbi:DUF3658 domain-containing protein [Methylocystis heyeri]|uniref:DUF1835 domain-containing protein n=1 Tax=Methylocystis heyeri TaxID=391905 RepID=A0A6B8KAJ6_9HYPH|nr:DUF3658 domain-containing protein [Methylocystis heyeri]QGM44492.1 DUF1835 domain-containing protein [Methylocystis heyeri]
MSQTIVHILPGHSAAGTVREALEQLGLNEKVVAIGDHLGYGPIDGDLEARRKWLDENMCDGGESVDEAELAWQEALAPDAFPIIWTCRSDAWAHSGFLEFLSRVGERPFKLIDATEVMIQTRAGPWRIEALGIVTEAQMISAGLFQRQREMSPAEIAEGREVWSRLKAENALLRITENDRLLSKPLTFFDAELLEEVPQDWERAVRVVGNALARFCCSSPRRLVSDSFIWGRYLALAEQGAVEIRGEGGMRDCHMRATRKAVS